MIVLEKGELPDDWTEPQKELFTRVYRFMVSNPGGIQHPRAPLVLIEHWQTIAHNAAFIAAELLENKSVRIIDLDTEQVIAESPGRTH